MKNFAQIVAILSVLLFSAMSHGYCFTATGEALSDAQTIRKSASNLGWSVGKLASIPAGIFIKGKAALYPQGIVEVCLRESSGDLQLKAQSSSSDAENAGWHTLPGKKTH